MSADLDSYGSALSIHTDKTWIKNFGPLYGHMPMLDVEGFVAKPCGTVYPDQDKDSTSLGLAAAIGRLSEHFKGRCASHTCICRERMEEERFRAAMERAGLDPDLVGPGMPKQDVPPPKYKGRIESKVPMNRKPDQAA